MAVSYWKQIQLRWKLRMYLSKTSKSDFDYETRRKRGSWDCRIDFTDWITESNYPWYKIASRRRFPQSPCLQVSQERHHPSNHQRCRWQVRWALWNWRESEKSRVVIRQSVSSYCPSWRVDGRHRTYIQARRQSIHESMCVSLSHSDNVCMKQAPDVASILESRLITYSR